MGCSGQWAGRVRELIGDTSVVTPKYLNLLSSSLDTPVEQGTYYSQEASVPAGCQGLRNVACLIFVSTLSRVTLLPIDR